MRSFLQCKSVGGGMMQLLDDYCQAQQIKSPIQKKYHIDQRISFETWLKCLQKIYIKQPIVGLGIDIGRYIQASHVGVLAYLAQSCENLAQFFALSTRYVNIWYNFTPIQITQSSTEICIEWEQPSYLQTGLYVFETTIAQELLISILWHRLGQLIGFDALHFLQIDLVIAKPKDMQPYAIFRCPIRFNQNKTRVQLPVSLLNIPLEKPDMVLFDILHQQAQYRFDALPIEENFIALVNQHILAAIQQQRAYIEYIATQMQLSSRQLNARLKAHNTSFQQCLKQVREQLAKHYLEDPHLSILDISLMLAYSEPASFNRAFKAWTGMNPSQWRQQDASGQFTARSNA